MASPDPVKQLDDLLSSSSFVFLLYYRGNWCPFCIAHIKELVALAGEIKAAGGTPVIVTAEVPEHLEKARAWTGFTDAAIVDPENILAKELKDRDLLDVAISSRWGYQHGMAQPALLVVKGDGTVLQRWAIVPGLMNIGGATDRPVLSEVWENVQAQLRGEKAKVDNYSTTGALDLIRKKIVG
ncbi:hypothetical protein QBC33DRAFT_540681 [Phialemonium atrogriseum]|uniref:Thioredoxin domain-containing protein n=1 Tax=Phialemonium atrogriseum TaxID=1093897 RepID=A0AAJ0FGT4_9PEZI|nr:uncharacterized protein QBC33DRAFT_540681 [Phialemonium atrogriseum]KAK1766932.1 hypothetical protein QBC33DRAFT_540681 [Phialemonium atrogriseum]